MINIRSIKQEDASVLTTTASLFTSIIAGTACIGPMLGIAFGITGLGWLSRYSYLTLPASIASIALLTTALVLFTKRKTSCASRRQHRWNIAFISVTSLIVVGINVFEYVIIPNLT